MTGICMSSIATSKVSPAFNHSSAWAPLWAPRGAIPHFPEVGPGTDLPALIVRTLRAADLAPGSGDALVVAQKIVSKAEGSIVDLTAVRPGAEAVRIAATIEKDPRLVEVVLRESTRVVRAHRGVLITEHRLGFICANAGVDHSNVGLGPDVELLHLLAQPRHLIANLLLPGHRLLLAAEELLLPRLEPGHVLAQLQQQVDGLIEEGVVAGQGALESGEQPDLIQASRRRAIKVW